MGRGADDPWLYVGQGLSGLIQGYASGLERKRQAELDQKKLAMQQAHIDSQNKLLGMQGAKAKADLAAQGFTESGDIDPGFYTPPNAVSPEASKAMDFAKMGAQAAEESTGMPAVSSDAMQSAQSQTVPAPTGNPSWLRAERAADLKRKQTAAAMDPNKAMLDANQQAEAERIMNLQPGSARGWTMGDFARAASMVRAGEAQSGRGIYQAGVDLEKQKRDQDFRASEAEKDRKAKAEAAKIKAAGKGAGISKGRQKADAEFAKEYSDYNLAGGDAKAEKDFEVIQNQINAMKNMKPGGLMNPLRSLGGLGGEYTQDLVDREMANIRENLVGAFTGTAKENFPGRMAVSEFQQFIRNKMNPRLTPQENAARLQEILDSMKARAEQRRKSAGYFETHGGTLEGFMTQPQGNPSDKRAAGVKQPQAPKSHVPPSSKPKMVKQNGVTYILNEKTGEYE